VYIVSRLVGKCSVKSADMEDNRTFFPPNIWPSQFHKCTYDSLLFTKKRTRLNSAHTHTIETFGETFSNIISIINIINIINIMHCQLLAGMNNHGADCLDNGDLARAMDCFRITLTQLNKQAVQECLAVAEPVLPVVVMGSHHSPPQQQQQSKSQSPIHPRPHDELTRQEPQRKKLKTCTTGSSNSSSQLSSSSLSLPNPSPTLPMQQQQPAERRGCGGGMTLIQPQYPKNLEIMVSCGTSFPFSDISSTPIASSSAAASASASLEQGSSSSNNKMEDVASSHISSSSSSLHQQPPPLLLYSRALRLVDSPGPCFSHDPSEEESICASLTAFNLGLACHLGGVVDSHQAQRPPVATAPAAAVVAYHPHQHQPHHHPSQLLNQAKKLYLHAHQQLLPIMAHHEESTGNALLDLLFLAVCNNLALLLLLQDCSADSTIMDSTLTLASSTTSTTTTTSMAHQLYVRVLRLALAVQSSTLYGPYYDWSQQVHNTNNINSSSIDQQFKATMTRTIDAFVKNAIQAGLGPPNVAPAA
jgi:hypothetical protein